MVSRWQYVGDSKRDLRIDWLRGLAMTLVIINHSRMSSVLSWFSYERFWIVTAAEVFVVLSGVVLGSVYSRKLVRDGWREVVGGLGRRASLLYLAFLTVTLSVLVLSAAGINAGYLVKAGPHHGGSKQFLDALTMTEVSWRDIAFMRWGPWTFQIVGLYVWLVAAAAPCLIAVRLAGWRPVLALSWGVYIWYRMAPYALTTAQFESGFPLMAWQLLFVHGIVIGYHREPLTAAIGRCPRMVPLLVVGATAAFSIFALCNPWMGGPSWLHWTLVSPDRFTYLYFNYFALTELQVGRLLNLAVALPVGYALLTRWWALARPLGIVFVTLGQQSLGAFILHVYALLLLDYMPFLSADNLWTNTLAQVFLVVAIAALLNGGRRLQVRRSAMATPQPQPLAA